MQGRHRVASGNDVSSSQKDSTLVERRDYLRLAMAKDIREVLCRVGTLLGGSLESKWASCTGNIPASQRLFSKAWVALKGRHTAIKSAQSWYKTIDRVTHNLTTKTKAICCRH